MGRVIAFNKYSIITLTIVAFPFCVVVISGTPWGCQLNQAVAPGSCFGWALGCIDDVAVRIHRSFIGGRFFKNGIGNIELLDESEYIMKRLSLGDEPLPKIENLLWKDDICNEKQKLIIKEATFDAPFSQFLPDECKKAHFQLIMPKNKPIRAIVVAFQMTADESFGKRKSIVSKMFSSGIATLLLMSPMYGTRRPKGQEKHFYRTVCDFLQAHVIGIVEGAMMVQWCRSEFPNAYICLTGISAGAVTAAGTALLTSERVAVVPCIGPSSGRPFVRGMLSYYVKWSSITKSLGCNSDEAKEFLLKLFDKKRLQNLSDWRKESGKQPSLISISVVADNDRCVLRDDSQELHEALQVASSHEEIHYFYGGHCSGIKLASAKFASAIARAIKLLEDDNTTSYST